MVRPKTFKLVRPTLALDVVDGQQRIVTLPADAIVTLRAGAPNRSGMVRVHWEARSLTMFAVDLNARGLEVSEPVATSGLPGAETLPSMINAGEWAR